MITAFAFVVAASAGTLARAEAGRRWNRHEGFPFGTLIVNVTGAFLLGLLSEVAPPTFTVLAVGGLGAFTTFSSFARDTVALTEQRRLVLAGIYLIATLAAGVAAAALGMSIASR